MSIETPTVSVIIPSARGGPYLREALRSVLFQTFGQWEVVVVLDGCTDDLADIKGSDPRLRFVYQERRGASIARNVGMLQARGELIALLDDDDRMLPKRLETQCRAFEREEVVVSHTQFQVIDADGVVTKRGNSTDSSYFDFLGADSHILSATAMFRKRVALEVGGFNSLLTMGEGQDLIHRIMREGATVFHPEVLYEYRAHTSNVWHGTARGTEETELTIRQHLLLARATGDKEVELAARRGIALIPSPRAALAFAEAQSARASGNWARAVSVILRALMIAPIYTLRWIARSLVNARRF